MLACAKITNQTSPCIRDLNYCVLPLWELLYCRVSNCPCGCWSLLDFNSGFLLSVFSKTTMRPERLFCVVQRLPNKHIFCENRFIYCRRIYLWLFVLYKHFTSTEGRRLVNRRSYKCWCVRRYIDRPSVSLYSHNLSAASSYLALRCLFRFSSFIDFTIHRRVESKWAYTIKFPQWNNAYALRTIWSTDRLHSKQYNFKTYCPFFENSRIEHAKSVLSMSKEPLKHLVTEAEPKGCHANREHDHNKSPWNRAQFNV